MTSAARNATTAVRVNNKRPITDPFPVPSVETVTVVKSSQQKLGIKIEIDLKANNGAVLVSGWTPESPIAQTNIEVGQEILAINGQAVNRTEQVVSMIRDNRHLEFTVFDHHRQRCSPFCYVEVAPTSRINPGISFDSCCNRTLVMVGDIFITDLTKTRLRRGDIVLAVNGVAVWKPEQADALQLQAARDSKSLVLYCVDMERLRDYFQVNVEKRQSLGGDDIRDTVVKKNDATSINILERDCRATARVDESTQLYVDETDWQMRVKTIGRDHTSKTLQTKNSYRACFMTIKALNKLLKEQLRVIKAKVVGQAWHSSVRRSDAEIPTYVVPSAPSSPVAIGYPDHNETPRQSLPMAHATPIDDAGHADLPTDA